MNIKYDQSRFGKLLSVNCFTDIPHTDRSQKLARKQTCRNANTWHIYIFKNVVFWMSLKKGKPYPLIQTWDSIFKYNTQRRTSIHSWWLSALNVIIGNINDEQDSYWKSNFVDSFGLEFNILDHKIDLCEEVKFYGPSTECPFFLQVRITEITG